MISTLQKPSDRRVLTCVGALLSVCVILTYWPGIDGEFVWDDVFLIRDNPDMKELSRVWEVAWGDYYQQGSQTRIHGGYLRPLPVLFNGMTVYWFGLSPAAFHIGNVLLHILAVWLAFLFLLQRGFSLTVSIWAVAFFAIHPLQTETVLFISCRSDLFASVGLFSVLYTYEKARSSSQVWSVLSLLAFAFALLSKEVVIGLPVVLFWLERMHLKGRIRRVGPFILMSLVYIGLRLSLVEGREQLYFTPSELPLAVVNLVGLYVSRAFWPMNPQLLYDGFPIAQLGLLTGVGCLAIILALWMIMAFKRGYDGLGLAATFCNGFHLACFAHHPLRDRRRRALFVFTFVWRGIGNHHHRLSVGPSDTVLSTDCDLYSHIHSPPWAFTAMCES